MNHLLRLFALAGAMATATASAYPQCVLPETVLRPFANGPSEVRFAEFHKLYGALNQFDVCARKSGQIDESSKRVLSDLVRSTFDVDYTPLYKKWKELENLPDSEDGPGVGDFQRDLLDFLDRIVDPSYLAYRDTILKYGDGEAIAGLGAAVSADVRRILGTAPTTKGVGAGYRISHAAAFTAIGYWIDPENSRVPQEDKAAMTEFLIGALPPDPHALETDLGYRIGFALLQALAHSNDPTVVVRVRRWAAARSAYLNPLAAEAANTATAIERRLLK